MAPVDRSFTEVLQNIVGNIQEILRSEVRLAKTEIREEAVKAKSAGVLLAAGAIAGLFASFFMLLALVYALSRVIPDWSAALVTALILGVIAAVALSAAIKQFKLLHPSPDRTIDSIKENVEWAKQQTK